MCNNLNMYKINEIVVDDTKTNRINILHLIIKKKSCNPKCFHYKLLFSEAR